MTLISKIIPGMLRIIPKSCPMVPCAARSCIAVGRIPSHFGGIRNFSQEIDNKVKSDFDENNDKPLEHDIDNADAIKDMKRSQKQAAKDDLSMEQATNLENDYILEEEDELELQSRDPSENYSPGERKIPTKAMYVGNLPWEVTSEELAKVIGSYTKVYSSRIIFDRFTRRSRGFGYVEIESKKLNGLVEKLQGMVYKGRALRVNEADSLPGGKPRRNVQSGYNTNRGNYNDIMTNKPPSDRFHNPYGNSQVELSEEQMTQSGKSFF